MLDNSNITEYDYNKAIEIAEGVYWIGYNYETIFRTNPYLIVDGHEAVVIDPGSSIDFFTVATKIESIIPFSQIYHLIIHHQDPDLCGSVTQFENSINHEIKIYNPKRSMFLVKFYDIKTPIIPINKDKEKLVMRSGRTLKFYMTPYCHAPGAMITYDSKTKTLFSSDIFGAFNAKWELYADMIGEEKHLQTVKAFMEPYMGSAEAMKQVADKLSNLEINMICPQHGSVIRKNIPDWISVLRKMNYGRALYEQVEWW